MAALSIVRFAHSSVALLVVPEGVWKSQHLKQPMS